MVSVEDVSSLFKNSLKSFSFFNLFHSSRCSYTFRPLHQQHATCIMAGLIDGNRNRSSRFDLAFLQKQVRDLYFALISLCWGGWSMLIWIIGFCKANWKIWFINAALKKFNRREPQSFAQRAAEECLLNDYWMRKCSNAKMLK